MSSRKNIFYFKIASTLAVSISLAIRLFSVRFLLFFFSLKSACASALGRELHTGFPRACKRDCGVSNENFLELAWVERKRVHQVSRKYQSKIWSRPRAISVGSSWYSRYLLWTHSTWFQSCRSVRWLDTFSLKRAPPMWRNRITRLRHILHFHTSNIPAGGSRANFRCLLSVSSSADNNATTCTHIIIFFFRRLILFDDKNDENLAWIWVKCAPILMGSSGAHFSISSCRLRCDENIFIHFNSKLSPLRITFYGPFLSRRVSGLGCYLVWCFIITDTQDKFHSTEIPFVW